MTLPFIRRLREDRRGLALIEFAFTLPIMLSLILLGTETANLGISIMRVHQIAAVTADNAARVRDSITESDVNEVLTGGKIIGERMDFANRGRIVLSDVMPNGYTDAKKGQTILWQRCTGGLNNTDSQPKYGTQGKGKDDATLQKMGTGSRQIDASASSALVFAEVTYRYRPVISARLVSGFLPDTLMIRSEAAFSVRERSSETLGTGASGTTASTCSRYDL